jgi:hypothetical protein
MPHVEVPKTNAAPTLPNGVVNGAATSPQPEPNGDAATIGTPARPKSQNMNSHLGVPSNGYYLPLTNMSAALLSSTYLPQNGQHAVGGLSLQQVQNLKSAFANSSATEMAALNVLFLLRNSCPICNFLNLKLPNTRQSQWAMGQPPLFMVN